MSNTRKTIVLASLASVAAIILGLTALFVVNTKQSGNAHSATQTKSSTAIPTMTPASQEIYPVTKLGIVYALDVKTGTTLWHTQIGNAYSCGEPLLHNNLVYCDSDRGFFALNQNDGSIAWQKLGIGLSQLPLFDATNVYYSTGPNAMTAFRASDGTQIWQYDGGKQSDDVYGKSAIPIIFDGTIYFGTSTLYAVKTTDGSLLWKFHDATPNSVYPQSEPFFINGTLNFANDDVYFNGGNRTFYALHLIDGTKAWSFPANSIIGVVDGNTVAIQFGADGNYSNAIGALNSITGKMLWSRDLGPQQLPGGIYSDNGQFYYAEFPTKYTPAPLPELLDVHAVNVTNGNNIWTLPNTPCNLSGTFSIQEPTLYVVQFDACSIDISSGKLKWTVRADKSGSFQNVVEDVQIIGGSMFLLDYDSPDSDPINFSVMAINLNGGGILWQRALP